MKKTYFWLLAIVMVAGYFCFCYFISPLISLFSDGFSPLVFGTINLVEVLASFALLLFFIFSETEKENHSLMRLWVEAKEIFFLLVFVLLVILPLTLLFYDILNNTQGFDYPLLVFLPSNLLFVFVAYKMFKQWGKIKKVMVVVAPTASVNKKMLIDTSVPLLPILWMGDKNHSLYKYVKERYTDVLVWDDIRSYDIHGNLIRIKTMGILIISYPIVDQKKIISVATEQGIAIIVVVKKKNYHNVAKVYGTHCIICQTDNRADYGCSLLSRLIEEHGKRIKP